LIKIFEVKFIGFDSKWIAPPLRVAELFSNLLSLISKEFYGQSMYNAPPMSQKLFENVEFVKFKLLFTKLIPPYKLL